MNRKYICMALLILLLLGMGCKKKDGDGTSISSGKPFKGGNDAIDFDFMESAPPSEIYDKGELPFEVTISLENKGEWDIAKEDIIVKLDGFYAPDFNNPETEKHPSEDLKGAYINAEGKTIPGTITYIDFKNFKYLPELAGNNEYKIRAEVCYKYGTKAQADLCFLEDLYNKEGMCVISEKKSVDVSSSPVQIEDFEESVGGANKIKFQFYVVQRGSGLVSREGSNCNDDFSEKNKVYVEVKTDLPGLSCIGFDSEGATSGIVRLHEGKRLISCTQDTSNLIGEFIKKANIILKFDYRDSKIVQGIIKHTID